MSFFIPHYEIHDELITPVKGSPAKKTDLWTVLQPGPRTRDNPVGFPPAIQELLLMDASEVGSVLDYVNRHGVMGVLAWDPFGTGELAYTLPKYLAGQIDTEVMLEDFRLQRICHEIPTPPEPAEVRDVGAAAFHQPCDLTVAMWSTEHLTRWRYARDSLLLLLHVIVSFQALLLSRRGPPEAKKLFSQYDLQNLHVLAEGIKAGVSGQVPPALEELTQSLVSDFPVKTRLVTVLMGIHRVSEKVACGSRPQLRPTDDFRQWTWGFNPPCLLNMLYVALFNWLTALTGPLRKCALPGCARPARANSRWCTVRHSDLHRKRRSMVKGQFSLTSAEISEVEGLVASTGCGHEDAAEQVVRKR